MPKRIVVLAVAGMFLVAAGPAAIADRDGPTGALWRVERDGDQELIADGSDGLLAPAGVAVGHDGAYYVTNKGVLALGQGEVLRISGH